MLFWNCLRIDKRCLDKSVWTNWKWLRTRFCQTQARLCWNNWPRSFNGLSPKGTSFISAFHKKIPLSSTYLNTETLKQTFSLLDLLYLLTFLKPLIMDPPFCHFEIRETSLKCPIFYIPLVTIFTFYPTFRFFIIPLMLLIFPYACNTWCLYYRV